MTTQNRNNNSRKPPLPPSAAASIAAAAATLGARPACAACKRQRRLCTVRCPLAPYFPADKQKDFDDVDRLFGVRRVAQLLKEAPPHSRQEAVKSIVYEANFRAKTDPVGGCCAAIRELLRRIHQCKAELQILEEKLAFHRATSQQNFDQEKSRNTFSDSRK